MTHETFGVPTLMTLVWNDRVLGLALETGFFAIGTVKLAVAQCAIIRGLGTKNIIPTVKSTTRRTAIPLAGMIGPIIGVDPPFTVQTIIGTVHEGRKRRTAIEMMIGFQKKKLIGCCGSFENQKARFHPGHRQ